MTVRTGRLQAIAPVLALVGLLALTACGGEAAGGDVATAGGDIEAASDGSAGEDAESDEGDQALVFAECMREHGVDMPDPEPGQQGFVGALRGQIEDVDEETLRAAFDACQDLVPTFQGENRPQLDEDAQLALADCLRDQGLDVPDNLFEGGFPQDISREELTSAMQECRDEVGGFGGPGQ